MERFEQHRLRGGFPLSFLADSDNDSTAWLKNFIQTLLERDLPQFGIGTPAPTLHRFWSMLAHYQGQIWNAAEPARSIAISESSTRRYLDLMEGVFMIRQLSRSTPTSGQHTVERNWIYCYSKMADVWVLRLSGWTPHA